MFNEDTKNLIDYAYQDNGTAFRDSLYNAIHDKVSAHIESKKQEIAAGLMGQQEEIGMDEEVESLEELSRQGLSNYISAAKSDTKERSTGIKLAQKKKWGDPKFGTTAAKVPANEGVAGVSPGGTCLASSNRPSIFSAKAHKEFDRVKNLSDKDSKDYHDTQIKKAQNSQRLRSEDVALEEGRKPSPITGTRKIASYEGDHGHTAEVRHSREYNEYQVHHYKNGVHQGEGPISYHGDDKEEAHDNAKYEVGMQPEIIKKK